MLLVQHHLQYDHPRVAHQVLFKVLRERISTLEPSGWSAGFQLDLMILGKICSPHKQSHLAPSFIVKWDQ